MRALALLRWALIRWRSVPLEFRPAIVNGCALVMGFVLRMAVETYRQRQQAKAAAREWADRSFLSTVQASVVSTESLCHGRVEKRTVFEEPLNKPLPNKALSKPADASAASYWLLQIVAERVIHAAKQTTAAKPLVRR